MSLATTSRHSVFLASIFILCYFNLICLLPFIYSLLLLLHYLYYYLFFNAGEREGKQPPRRYFSERHHAAPPRDMSYAHMLPLLTLKVKLLPAKADNASPLFLFGSMIIFPNNIGFPIATLSIEIEHGRTAHLVSLIWPISHPQGDRRLGEGERARRTHLKSHSHSLFSHTRIRIRIYSPWTYLIIYIYTSLYISV